jgi:CyaY protein
MTEQEFLDACDRVLEAIEDAIDASGIDADTERAGQVLTLEFDDGSKIIVNGNAPVREIWVAARSGGYHFRAREGRWLDTRSGEELFAGLSKWVSQQAGEPVVLGPRP